MTLETLIATYGYAAVVVGTFLEGEMILIMAGFAASHGWLDLSGVMLSGLAGSFFGDQLYFCIGRFKGRAILRARPHWQPRAGRVFALLERHHIWLILGFRFLYGLRTATPIIIGTSGIAARRYFVMNLLGAIIWSIVIAALGYAFANALELVIVDLKRYELMALGALAAVGLVAWLVHRRRIRRLGKV